MTDTPSTRLGAARSLAAAAALLLALVARPAAAQDAPRRSASETTTLGIFFTQYWLDLERDGDARSKIGGGGARLMTNIGRAPRAHGAWFTRSALGVFGVYTAKQSSMTTLHVGLELDAHLLPQPLVGVVDPFLSVSAGAFRTKVTVGGLLGEEDVTETDLALTPGAGTYVHLTPNVSIRGDVRDVVVLGERTTSHNIEASVGLALHF